MPSKAVMMRFVVYGGLDTDASLQQVLPPYTTAVASGVGTQNSARKTTCAGRTG